jgi:hypothetical protein
MEIKKTLVLALFVLSLPAAAAAQTAEEVNEANNPLTPKITVNLQDNTAAHTTVCAIAIRTQA